MLKHIENKLISMGIGSIKTKTTHSKLQVVFLFRKEIQVLLVG